LDAFVEEVTEATPELVEALARLVPQLSRSSPPPTEAQLAEIVASPSSVLLVARLGGEGEQQGTGGSIVGTLTLVLFRIPTAMRAWIEDVVVDESARGTGVGEALTLAALERAADAGARTVDLTSRPSREAANRLYTRLGFELRETNVYRWTHPTT
jgi:ribosomal protein S18 acetylase RimI-like enzyme